MNILNEEIRILRNMQKIYETKIDETDDIDEKGRLETRLQEITDNLDDRLEKLND